jgi:RNA polymerase sigma-70 factor (ECF subfamily)
MVAISVVPVPQVLPVAGPGRRAQAPARMPAGGHPAAAVAAMSARRGAPASQSDPAPAQAAAHAAVQAELAMLMLAVQAGCQASFARLYASTFDKLLGMVLRITRDRCHADDVMQDVYLKAWLRCRQFDEGKGAVMFWLGAIAQNSAIDSLRRAAVCPLGQRRSRGADEDDADAYAGLAARDLQPPEALQRGRSEAALRQGLAALARQPRDAVVLAYFSELTHSEIATRLGRPLGTVKTWVRRSLGELRPALAEHR